MERLLLWLGLLGKDYGCLERRLTAIGLCVVIVMWVSAVIFMSTVGFSGDERFYYGNSGRIVRYLSGEDPFLVRFIVAFGWFMPGPSIFLAPARFLDPAAENELIRFYVSIPMLPLWLWTLREVSAAFGHTVAKVFLIFPSMAPVWLLFSSTLWGDLSGGLLLAIVCARTHRLALAALSEQPVRARELLVLGLIMAVMVYLRGSLLAAVVAVHVFLLAIWIISGQWSSLLSRSAKLCLCLGVFSALLAPWSLTASTQLRGTVVTTTTLPISIGATFGNTDDICFGPCPGTWKPIGGAARFSRLYARERGLSELEVQRQMAARALRDLTFESYATRVRQNFRSFVTRPGGFVPRFLTLSTFDLGPDLRGIIEQIINSVNFALYLPFFAAMVLANAAVMRAATPDMLASLCIKMFTLCMFLQIFAHPSHSRYWIGFAPLMGISGGLLLTWWREQRTAAAASTIAAGASRRILVGIQAAYVVVIGLLALAIGFA